MEHPAQKELEAFWTSHGKKYTRELLEWRIPCVNWIVASDSETLEETAALLLKMHPRHPDLDDRQDKSKKYIGGRDASDVDVRLALAKNTKYESIIQVLESEPRQSIVDAMEARKLEIKE